MQSENKTETGSRKPEAGGQRSEVRNLASGLRSLASAFYEWRAARLLKKNARLRGKFFRTAAKMARPTVLSNRNVFQLARIGRRAERRVTQKRFRFRYFKPDTVQREMKRRFVIGSILRRA